MKTLKHWAITAAVCIALSGCSSTGTDRREDAKRETRSAIPSLPEMWASEANTDIVSDVGWLTQLNAPELVELVVESMKHNNNLIATAANVEASGALHRQASAALSPQVGVSAGSSSGGLLEGNASNSYNVGIQASWELDLWGRLSSGDLAARESFAAAQADFEFAKQSLAANVARAYFVAVEAQKQLDLARQTVDTLKETLRIVQLQFDNGLADQQGLSLTKSDLATAQESLKAGELGVRDAKRAVELLLGRYPSAAITVETELPDTPINISAGLPSQLLERRPDIIAAERRVAAAFNSVDQAKAAKLPSLSLTANTGGSSQSLSDVLNPANMAWQAISSLVAPLIDGGRLDAQIDAATAEQSAAVAAYAQTALSAFSDVEQLLDQNTVLQERKKLLDEALKEAENAEHISQLQYDEGEISLLDVLTIQQRVFAARRNVIAMERASVTQFVDLNLALGGGWQ